MTSDFLGKAGVKVEAIQFLAAERQAGGADRRKVLLWTKSSYPLCMESSALR
jgi:hypothetical protein